MRQYQAAYAGGQAKVWNVMLGRMVGEGGRGLGVEREEHPSVNLARAATSSRSTVSIEGGEGRPPLLHLRAGVEAVAGVLVVVVVVVLGVVVYVGVGVEVVVVEEGGVGVV